MANTCISEISIVGTLEQIRELHAILKDRTYGIPYDGFADLRVGEMLDRCTAGHPEDPPRYTTYMYLLGRLLTSADLDPEKAQARRSKGEVDALGCKDDVDYEVLHVTEDGATSGIFLRAESAWTPPLEAMRLVSKKYGVDIFTTYTEEQMGFGGCQRAVNGEITIDAEGPALEFMYAVNGGSTAPLFAYLEAGTLTLADIKTFPKNLQAFLNKYATINVYVEKKKAEETTVTSPACVRCGEAIEDEFEDDDEDALDPDQNPICGYCEHMTR
jgi:hypothetical protein